MNTLSFGRALILSGLMLAIALVAFYTGTHFPAAP